MRIPAESLPGTSVRDKVVTAAEAVRLIRDGDWAVVEGFVGQCFAEELTLALEQRFLLTGAPRDLGLVFTMAPGNRQGRGLDRLCHEGLLKRAVGGHWGLSPELGKMAVGNKIEVLQYEADSPPSDVWTIRCCAPEAGHHNLPRRRCHHQPGWLSYTDGQMRSDDHESRPDRGRP